MSPAGCCRMVAGRHQHHIRGRQRRSAAGRRCAPRGRGVTERGSTLGSRPQIKARRAPGGVARRSEWTPVAMRAQGGARGLKFQGPMHSATTYLLGRARLLRAHCRHYECRVRSCAPSLLPKLGEFLLRAHRCHSVDHQRATATSLNQPSASK